MKRNTELKIAIIGAGAAGLTCAETLREKGYNNITIFEKEDHAGGKCRSIEYKGRSYELGAGVIAESYRTIVDLAQKYGIKTEPIYYKEEIVFDAKTGTPKSNYISPFKKLILGLELLRYIKLLNQFKQIENPGLLSVPDELCNSFSTLSEHKKITKLAKEFEYFFTGFGYGYFSETPAVFVLKHYSWGTIMSFLKKRIYKFPDGIQSLWEAVAKNHQVKYDSNIKSITRAERTTKPTTPTSPSKASPTHPVTIKTEQETHTFDRLIITSPLDESLQYLDSSPKEKELFSKIEYNDYRTFACLLKNFPPKSGYIPENFKSSRKGHPLFWYQRYEDSNLYTFYIQADPTISDKEIKKNIESLVMQMGGSIEKHLQTITWKYFPHVTSELMKNGYFNNLENLQGKNNTYYAGELLNFSTTEHSASYAKKLINKHF